MSDETNEPNADQALIGRVLAERYRVERLLGSGGMGSVYLAEHVLMKKAVALKVLHREMTILEEVVARFEREAVAAARIDHPHVAAAMDFGRLEDGSCYLVLEYVAGKSLRDLIDEGPLPVERALPIASQIASALAAAHAAGIVHRDLKPDNVMLVENQDRGDWVKVLDFGIAKVLEPEQKPESQRALTRIGAVMGTPGYMSPEQALGQSVDGRTDLYAFGVVLYEMLAGKLPYDAPEATQILAKQLTEAPAPLPEGIPAGLTTLVDKLLQKDASQRLASASELVARLSDPGSSPAEASAPTVLGLENTGAESARSGSPSGDVPGVTAPGSQAEPRDPRRRTPLIAALLVAVGVLGAAFAWGSRGASGEPQPLSSAVTAASASPKADPAPSAAPAPSEAVPAAAASRTEGPGNTAHGGSPGTVSSSTQSFTSETKTTRSPDGKTVTTRTSTRRSTTTEKKTTKRRTGPGGIYIPPPSEWFK